MLALFRSPLVHSRRRKCSLRAIRNRSYQWRRGGAVSGRRREPATVRLVCRGGAGWVVECFNRRLGKLGEGLRVLHLRRIEPEVLQRGVLCAAATSAVVGENEVPGETLWMNEEISWGEMPLRLRNTE